MIGFFALVSKTLPSFAQCPAITYPNIFRVLHNIQPELVRKSSKFCTVAKQYLSENIPNIAQYPKIFRVLRNVQPILVKKSSEYCTMFNQYLSKKSSEYCTKSNKYLSKYIPSTDNVQPVLVRKSSRLRSIAQCPTILVRKSFRTSIGWTLCNTRG